jgi:hypothetical protein
VKTEPETTDKAPADLTETAPAAGQQAAETQTAEQDENGAPAATQSVQVGEAPGFAPQPAPSTQAAATPSAVAADSVAVTPHGSAVTTPPETAMHTDTQPHAKAPVKAPVKTAIAKGNAYVQLAAIRDKAAASASWKNLQKLYPQLAGEKYRVESANVKGTTYYRVQAGPFSAERAKAVCKSVNAKKAGACLVVSG